MQTPDQPLHDEAASPASATRARGRPRAFDREAALSKAMRLFWQKGYEATSLADLTAAMGIASPSLYAAFGSKEALFVEALNHYGATYAWGWKNFLDAPTARAAVQAWLMDSAAFLTGGIEDVPLGCMATLSVIGAAGHPELCEQTRTARAAPRAVVRKRLEQGAANGEIPASVDLDALARFVHIVQNGMSLHARDGASRAELEAAVQVAMRSWDALVEG
jgi:AcrR family transcriptional regulator